jgi:hypothetical protein
METIRSSATSVLAGATWRHISEDGILQYISFVSQKFSGLVMLELGTLTERLGVTVLRIRCTLNSNTVTV